MSKKVGVSLSIPVETLEAIKTMAENDHRTISAMVTLILAEAVKKEAQKSR